MHLCLSSDRVRRVIRSFAFLGVLGFAGLMLWAATLPKGQILIVGDVPTAPRDPLQLLRHYLHYGLFAGRGGGEWPQHTLDLATLDLHPGDIVLCRLPGSVHGTWSHVTVYLGDGRVLSHDLQVGLGTEPLVDLRWYERIRVLRPDQKHGTEVVVAARALIGSPFHLLAHPSDPWQQTCAKAAVDAWAKFGTTITDGRFWPTPDAIAAGPCAVVAELSVNP